MHRYEDKTKLSYRRSIRVRVKKSKIKPRIKARVEIRLSYFSKNFRTLENIIKYFYKQRAREVQKQSPSIKEQWKCLNKLPSQIKQKQIGTLGLKILKSF